MAYFQSAGHVEKNTTAWSAHFAANNLSLQKSLRRHLPKIDCFADFMRMPPISLIAIIF